MLRASLAYVFTGCYILLLGPVAILWTAVSNSTAWIYRVARTCIGISGWISGVRVKCVGLERIAPGQTYLFLSNHQSNLDGPALFHALPRDLRVVVKREMMRLPILSIGFRQVQFVPIDRADPVGARASIDEGARLLGAGLSFLAFPEGTRSRSGKLGVFKKGVFVMAIQAGTPVLPITIRNSRQLQPPGSYGIRPGTVELIVHDPIPTNSLSVADRDRLVENTRAIIASALSGPAISGGN